MGIEDGRRPLCLLSLDGGGIRGISSILILKEIMRQVNRDRDPANHLQPWQVFDLIGGTSTGGIIAIMLGRLRMTLDECHEAYMKLSKQIFKPKRWKYNFVNRGLDFVSANEKFDSLKLEEVVKEIIKNRTGTDHTPLQDMKSPCKVFVTTVRADISQLLLLRSYHIQHELDEHSKDFELWEAARATSAASTYFKEYRRENVGYLDGALKRNNPVFEVMREASGIWQGREAFLLSIGTGIKPGKPIGGHMISLALTLTKQATETEETAERFYHAHKSMDSKGLFFRFTVPQLGGVDLGDIKLVGKVHTDTSQYLRNIPTAKELKACAGKVSEIHTKDYLVQPVSEPRKASDLSDNEKECLRALSAASGNYETQRLSIEKPAPGTCEWFAKHPRYGGWWDDKASSMLWVTANPGCGKSVLSSFFIDSVRKQCPDAIVCYFFFKGGEDGRQRSNQALCALLHQIFKSDLSSMQVVMDEFSTKDASSFTQGVEVLWETLCAASDQLKSRHIICILDALDECLEESRNRLIDLMAATFPQSNATRKLHGNLKFLVTGRPWPTMESRFRLPSALRLRGENEATALSQDVELMVKYKMEILRNNSILSPETCSLLEAKVTQGADRTFLWAALVFEGVSRLQSRKHSAVKRALLALPSDLDQLYETALSSAENPKTSRRLLQLILAATRPLSLDEINLALNIEEAHSSLQDLLADLEPNIEYTVKQLGGFFVRVIDSTVFLVHQTAREFLLDAGKASSGNWRHSISLLESNWLLAQSCTNFLLLEGWPTRAMTPTNKTDWEISNKAFFDKFPTQTTSFYQYAAKNWSFHIEEQGVDFEPCNTLLISISRLCDLQSDAFSGWWYVFTTAKYFLSGEHFRGLTSSMGKYPLHYAALTGHFGIMNGFVASKSLAISARNHLDVDCLVVASMAGQRRVVEWLLGKFDTSSLQLGPALHCGTRSGGIEISKLLIDAGIDLNVKYRVPRESLNIQEETHLEVAIYHPVMIELLLGSGATNMDGAIVKAAAAGECPSLGLLLKADANRSWDERLPVLQLALKTATEQGRPMTMRQLLEADVPEPEGFDASVGMANAVKRGGNEDLQGLIEMGAHDDGEALLARSAFGDPEALNILLGAKDYPQNVLNSALLIFFDTFVGIDVVQYLAKTIQRVLPSSGDTRLFNGFKFVLHIGHNRKSNEQFLTTLMARDARLPSERFHQVLGCVIALDETLALFLLANHDKLRDGGCLNTTECYLLACLWGRASIVEYMWTNYGSQARDLDSGGWPLMMATVSGNLETLKFLNARRHGPLGENTSAAHKRNQLESSTSDTLASHLTAVEEALGGGCLEETPFALAQRLDYEDVLAEFAKDLGA